jgi:GTP-binding protein Era
MMAQGKTNNFRAGFVGIIGRTNVGKSTLLNRFIGEKIAIVSDIPQTTRNRILGVRTLQNAQIAFIDTPGFHKPKHKMNRAMVHHAGEALNDVDLIIFMIAADEKIGGGDQFVVNLLQKHQVKAIGAINKIDIISRERTLPMIETMVEQWKLLEAIPISALTGENCERLLDAVIQYLPESHQLYPDDYLTDQPERFIVSEIIREKVFHKTKEEIPHSTAVLVDRYQEKEDDLVVLDVTIYVDKESQKSIMIGKQGRMLKNIGTVARQDIERFLGKKIYLDLFVKVKKKWREDKELLKELGIL